VKPLTSKKPVLKALVTNRGKILDTGKELPETEPGEDPEESIKAKLEEQDLETEVHRVIDVNSREEKLEILDHLEADSRNGDWIEPEKAQDIYELPESQRIRNFLEKLEKIPTR